MCNLKMKAPTGTLRLALTDSELASESLSLTPSPLIGRLTGWFQKTFPTCIGVGLKLYQFLNSASYSIIIIGLNQFSLK